MLYHRHEVSEKNFPNLISSFLTIGEVELVKTLKWKGENKSDFTLLETYSNNNLVEKEERI